MTELILVRHGQTESNIKKYLQGQSDGPLIEIGKKQARAIAEVLKEKEIDMVISSPLIRARDTAKEIAKVHGLPVVENPILREWHCGKLDGLPAEALFEALEKAGLPIAEFRPEGGETLIEVQARAKQFLDEVEEKYDGLRVVVCSHGDFLRMLISLLLGLSIEEANEIHIENAAYSRFVKEGDKWVRHEMNQLS
jgi:broad specificity phosphatase PhoE